VTGVIDGQRVLLGNRLLMEAEGVPLDDFEQEADSLRRDGATVIFAAVDGAVSGPVAIADPVKGDHGSRHPCAAGRVASGW